MAFTREIKAKLLLSASSNASFWTSDQLWFLITDRKNMNSIKIKNNNSESMRRCREHQRMG